MIYKFFHFTMKNEGWGFKEDQIPSSSHFYIKRWALNCIFILNALNLQILWLVATIFFYRSSPFCIVL